MTSIAIVVLNWNGIEDTEKCLESLLLQTYKNFTIVVVDNGSIDTSVQRLQHIVSKEKNIVLIKNKINKGFAGGVNTGISYALQHDYDAVALFNNDATADKDWLKNLSQQLTDTNASIITGLLLSSDGKKIDSTAENYSIWGMPFPRARGFKAENTPESGYVFGATGGATLYKTSLFKEIGLFDEAFFAYYEDVDISFRAQLEGHTVYFTKTAIAYHEQGATSKKIPGFTVYQTFKNIPLLFTKNVPLGLIPLIGSRLFILYILFFANAIRRGAGLYALKGWLSSIRFFWIKSLWERHTIQSKRKVSTGYIRSILYPDLPPDQTGMRKLRSLLTGK